MRQFLTSLTGILVAIAIAACSSPAAPAGGPSPQPTCDQPETVKDSPDTVAALQSKVVLNKAALTAASANAHVSGCQGAAVTRIDFVLDVTIRDVTAPMSISNTLGVILNAMEQVAPGLPGDVTANFESTGQVQTLNFTRELARQAVASGLSGTEFLSALGYPARAGGSGTCSELPGKQPLADLTRQAQATFDKAGLSTATIAVAANGVWCGERFTPRQTEFHVALEWANGISPYQEAVRVGTQSAAAIDVLRDFPKDSLPGDLPPRLVLTTTDWDIAMTTVVTLEQAAALRDSRITGAELYKALGFPSRFLKGGK